MKKGGREKRMFSPNLVRYIIDPDNITGENTENNQVLAEKQVFRLNKLEHEKILSDYSFFSKIFNGFGRIFAFQSVKK